MNVVARKHLVLAVSIVAAAAGRSAAQETQKPAALEPLSQSTHVHDPQRPGESTSLPNLWARQDWPEPVSDNAVSRYAIFDLAEFQSRSSASDAFRWDAYGWHGGDARRFWFKSEGRLSTDSSEESDFEAQALYGKLISPFFDLQAGVRVARRLREGPDTTRVYAVIGLQGLSPYRFELEPSLFVSDKGDVSARVTVSIDLLLSQRLILQPRLETNLAAEADEEFGVGAGWNDAEFGLRLRYEARRELGWYVGVTRKKSFGETRRLAAGANEDTSDVLVVAGVRAWF